MKWTESLGHYYGFCDSFFFCCFLEIYTYLFMKLVLHFLYISCRCISALIYLSSSIFITPYKPIIFLTTRYCFRVALSVIQRQCFNQVLQWYNKTSLDMKIWIDHHIQIILVFMLFSGGICSGWERNHKRDTALVSNT